MLTIIRKNLLLTINDNVIPAMGSSDVPVKFVNDTETYVGFLIEPRVGYYVNGCPKSTVCEYDTSSNTIKIPAEAFKNKGILVIAIALVDNADSNHIEVTKELALEVTPAPNGTVILPAMETWQTAVSNLVEQIYNLDYKPQFDQIEEDLSGLVEEAENQQVKAKEQQTQIDNAIDIMGDYEIVQDNPTQIRFKKGDGTYGDTVNLGDNLASKSMVNAGYDTYSGNSYSGSASDYGIEIGKASGNYEQEGTPTPESPVEPKFFEPKEFVSVGKNCLDHSSADKFSSFSGIDDDGYINITANGNYKNFYIKKSSVTLKPNTTYTFVVDVKENSLVGSSTQITFGNSLESGEQTYFDSYKKIDFSSPLIVGITKFKLTTKEKFYDSNIMYGDRGLVSNTATSGSIKFRYAIYEGDLTNVDIGFEPFKGSNITPLSLILRALPNGVKDTYENGVITRRVGVLKITRETPVSGSDFTTTNRISYLPNDRLYPVSISTNVITNTHQVTNIAGDFNKCNQQIDNGDIHLYFKSGTFSDINEYYDWLDDNKPEIYYELAEPTTERVDLPVIPSYFPYTNAWHDSKVEASDLTWNILARQYGSGQTTIKKDEAVLTELDLNTERTATPTTVKVQLKDTSGNTFYVETSADNVYLKGTDGTEISQQNLNEKFGQLINLVAFYSANPTTVLADLKKYITTIT